MGVEPVIDISKVNEEREREGEGQKPRDRREKWRKTRGGGWWKERGWGPTAREKDKDGRRRRHRKGGVKGGEGVRGGELETEREIDVEGLSTTDKYYIRTA